MALEKFYVVAGNFQQYKNWIVDNALQNGYNRHYIYVSSVKVLIGLGEIHGIFIGTYRDREDIQEIVERIRFQNRIPSNQPIIPPENLYYE